jgi:large subunit ribosomal protein L18
MKLDLENYYRRKNRVRNKIKTSNKSNRPRICVFRSNKNFYAQLIDDSNCGNILVSHSSLISKDKIKKDHKAVDIAKIIGEEFAKKCIQNKLFDVVFDKGAYAYTGRVKSFAEACRENGLKF